MWVYQETGESHGSLGHAAQVALFFHERPFDDIVARLAVVALFETTFSEQGDNIFQHARATAHHDAIVLL